MIIHRVRNQPFPERLTNAVVTVGNYDGVHIGHQELLRRTKEIASDNNGMSVALTFDPHPVKLFKPGEFMLIQPIEERLALFERAGVDVSLVLEFNRALADQSAREFVENYLLRLCETRCVVIGFNTTFGKDRSGDPARMMELGREFGFETVVVPAVTVRGAPVSSSRIRRAVAEGHVEEATALLGRPFALEGTVTKGYGRGSSILNMPTANILSPGDLIPGEGVYAVWVLREGRRYKGALSIGTNPTFSNDRLSVEVFLLDFEGHLYGERLRVEFIRRLRVNRRFDRIEDLKAQICRDVDEVRRVLG